MPSSKAKKKPKQTLGRREKVDLPDLGITEVDAKIDTGAYTAALHCHDIKIITRKGAQLLQFRLLDPQHPRYERKTYRVGDFKSKLVKSSNGKSEQRFVIKSTVRILEKDYIVEFSLADRSAMRYPVLLGRRFLKSIFVVDVSKVNLANKKSKK